ncbi:ACN9-domain-containing protein [Morchella conica CCBAS932]|uniref:Succinate dehydrogenase assembly factor 3 n=1 Tax=Morchella conica CCBAS932 TaxID=1392247 RepID=A0A3N4KD42_9PEZI|nr:ACN9-domain-containing protein [Morchella conica CCBAS932]
MRTFHRLLASHGIPNKAKSTLALLPPIPLYRRLFRAHRNKLGPMMGEGGGWLVNQLWWWQERFFGDEYIKAEFRRHRDIDNPLQIVGFLKEWQLYAQKIEGDTWRDEKLDEEKLNKMSDQQVGQLYELMKAIKNPHGDGEHGEGEGGNAPPEKI